MVGYKPRIIAGRGHSAKTLGMRTISRLDWQRGMGDSAGRFSNFNGCRSAMWIYALKVGLTALLVVAIAELAKRSSFWAAALASLPLTSLLAMVWLYLETGDASRVASLSQSIFWLVLPSLVLFVLLPLLLRAGVNFWPSLGVSSAATFVAYVALVWVLSKSGWQL
jgi:hypothetical protein